MNAKLWLTLAAACGLMFAQGQKAPAMSDEKYGTSAEIQALPAARLNELVADPKVSAYAKAKACQRLALVGDASSVGALSRLLTDEQLSAYARTALEQIPGQAADEALRAALGKVTGKQLVGVINSIGVRRDAKALDALSRYVSGNDPELAKAADAALARIRPPL